MFLGAIDSDIRRYIAKHAEAFNGRDLVVSCSGNFTSERIFLEESKPASVHSNDVPLYTRILAEAMLGEGPDYHLLDDRYAFAAPAIESEDRWVRAAAVILLLRVIAFEKQKTLLQRMRWQQHVDAWDALVEESASKLRERAIPITSYFSGDIFEHLLRHGDNPNAVFVAYFPFYKGGYEHLYKRLHEIVEWGPPSYPMLDKQRTKEIVDWMLEPGRNYLFLLGRNPSFDNVCVDIEPQMISNRNRNTFNYLYCNLISKTALFRRDAGGSDKRFVLVDPGFRFTRETRISIASIKPVDVLYYKGLFLSRKIDFSSGQKAFALLADGKVFGFLEFTHGGKAYSDKSTWYMLSDFPSEPKPHPKTSKLVLMLSRCADLHRALDLSILLRTKSVCTTAFTDKPVSMKYRGVYTLVKRGEGFLNYGSPWTNDSAQETYLQWLKKFATA